MFYNVIKPLALKKDIENFRWVPTVYEIKWMSTETRDEKIAIIIRLISVIEGIWYTWSYKDMKLTKRFNEKLYNQALSNATMYAAKPKLAVWGLFKALLILCQDVNHWFNVKVFSKKKLAECFEVWKYDDYFNHRMTEEEKEKVENRELDGMKDLDWKAMSFHFKLKNGEEVSISRRLDVNNIRNPDLLYILDTLERDADQQYILDNIEKTNSKKKRFIIVDLFISCVFKQPITKYKKLVDAKEYIEWYSEVEI